MYHLHDIREISVCHPYALLGNPKIFQNADAYTFQRPAGSSRKNFDIFKYRPFEQEPPAPFRYITISRSRNVALAGGWPLIISPENFGWKYYWALIKNLPNWTTEQRNRDENFDRLSSMEKTMKYMKEMVDNVEYPGSEGSLGYIIDLIFTIPVESYIVERREGLRDHKTPLLRHSSSTVKNIIVTLRSNHVTPGWKFNSETVRWYIDDINLTTRKIPWLTEYLPELHNRK